MKYLIIAILSLTFTAQIASATPALKFGEKLAEGLGKFLDNVPNTEKILFDAPYEYINQVKALNAGLNPRMVQINGVKGALSLKAFRFMQVALKTGHNTQIRSGDEIVTLLIKHSEADPANPFLEVSISKVAEALVENGTYVKKVADDIIDELGKKVTAGVKQIRMDSDGRDGMSKLTELFIDGATVNPDRVTSLIKISDDTELLRYSYSSKIPLSKLEVGDIEALKDVFSRVIGKSSDDAAGGMHLELPGM